MTCEHSSPLASHCVECIGAIVKQRNDLQERVRLLTDVCTIAAEYLRDGRSSQALALRAAIGAADLDGQMRECIEAMKEAR